MKRFFPLMFVLCFAASAFCRPTDNIKVNSVQQRLPWQGIVDVSYTIILSDTTHDWDVAFALIKGKDTLPVTPESYTCRNGLNDAVFDLNKVGRLAENAMGDASLYLTLVDKGAHDLAAEQAALEAKFDSRNIDSAVAATIAQYEAQKNNYDFWAAVDAHSYWSLDTLNGKITIINYLLDKPIEQVDSLLEVSYSERSITYISYAVFDSLMRNSHGFMLLTNIFTKDAAYLDELNKCTGDEADLSVLDVQSDMETFRNLFGTFPVKKQGMLNVMGRFFVSLPNEIFHSDAERFAAYAETCRCILESDVFFKSVANNIEAMQALGVSLFAKSQNIELQKYNDAKRLQELRNH